MAADDPTTGPDASAGRIDTLLALARDLSGLLRELHLLVPSEEPDYSDLLLTAVARHLGVDPRALPTLSQEFPTYQLVDLQLALDRWADEGDDRELTVLGASGQARRYHPFSELLAMGHALGADVGPVDYVDMPDSADSTRRCIQCGVLLFRSGDERVAALLRGPDPNGARSNVLLELVGDQDVSSALLAELRHLAVRHSALRGAVLGLAADEGESYGGLHFLRRPTLARDSLVMDDAALRRIERHVLDVAHHRQRLREAGQHLKRGILLYGPPGTGKTHTVRYLLSQLTDVTVFVLAGQALDAVGDACALARQFQPSVVVLEDVDLIAPDRTFGDQPLLYEVLNQIDGLGEDVDVTFLLTTNRVDIVESALSERPGRVDLAIEIPPPDAEGRARLLRLYGAGVGLGELAASDLVATVEATAGLAATFLREVVRRAAMIAAANRPDGRLHVDADELLRATRELLGDRAALAAAVESLTSGAD